MHYFNYFLKICFICSSVQANMLCVCSVCCIIRPWVLILGVLRLLHHPSVDPCMVCSVLIQQGSTWTDDLQDTARIHLQVIRPGGSLLYQDGKLLSEKYFILSHSAQIMYEISNSLDIATSLSMNPWFVLHLLSHPSVDPWFVLYLHHRMMVCSVFSSSSFNGFLVYYEQNIQSLLITIGADPEIIV